MPILTATKPHANFQKSRLDFKNEPFAFKKKIDTSNLKLWVGDACVVHHLILLFFVLFFGTGSNILLMSGFIHNFTECQAEIF